LSFQSASVTTTAAMATKLEIRARRAVTPKSPLDGSSAAAGPDDSRLGSRLRSRAPDELSEFRVSNLTIALRARPDGGLQLLRAVQA